jgi:hypothetical protein
MVSRAGGPFQENASYTICTRFRKVRPRPLEAFYRRHRTSLHIVYWARENGMFPGICDGAYRGHHQCSEAASNRPLRFYYRQVGSYHLINS